MENLDNVIINSEDKNLKDKEKIILYTEEKEPIGIISKGLYGRINTLSYNGRKVHPWIECVTCFIVDPSDGKIAVELRGKDEIDAGMLDTVSGHVRYGEISKTTMAREMHEEVGMFGYTNSEIVDKLNFLGRVKVDFSKKHEKMNLRCFATVYAFLVDSKESIMANESAVANLAWVDKEDVKNAIRASMFRFPYTEENKDIYERIFENLDKAIIGEHAISVEEYLRDWK